MSEVQPEAVQESVEVVNQDATNIVETTVEPVVEAVEGEVKKEEIPAEPKKNHEQRRWERLLRERAEFKAKAEYLEKMQTQAVTPQINSGEPTRESFDSDLSYLEARQDYKLKLATSNQPNQPQSNWVDLEEKARESYSDFDEVMEDARDIMIPQASADAIASSSFGADLQYYLAKNPNEAKRLWAMSNAVDQIRAIGKIEASIEAKKHAKPIKASSAPKPITPVKTTGGEVEVDLDKLSDKAYFDLMKKRKMQAMRMA